MSGVRILILSFGMPRGTSLAAALWAAERDLKTPTTGFMVLSLSGRVLIGALGGVGNNQVFAARGGRSLGYYGGGFSEWWQSAAAPGNGEEGGDGLCGGAVWGDGGGESLCGAYGGGGSGDFDECLLGAGAGDEQSAGAGGGPHASGSAGAGADQAGCRQSPLRRAFPG